MTVRAAPHTSGPARRRAGWARPPWLGPVAVGVLGVAVCVVLAVVDPEDRATWSPRCPFRAATGLDCPGCGGTRALAALVRGEPALAADHNVLTLALLPVLAYGWFGWLAASLGRRRARPELSTRTAWVVAVAVPAFMLARNLPWGPLGWLASGAG